MQHTFFSPGYKDSIKFTKSRHRGHRARYWYELVSSQAITYLNSHLDHFAPNQRRRDVLGLSQVWPSNNLLGDRLITVPTRPPHIFHTCTKTVGCAWHL